MRNPKRLLQKWLGIEAIATRIAQIDMELHPPITVTREELENGVKLTGTWTREADVETPLPEETLVKGYEN